VAIAPTSVAGARAPGRGGLEDGQYVAVRGERTTVDQPGEERGRSCTVASTGVTLDYVEHGDARHPTVLLVMGMTGQRILWPEELVEGLVAAGLHVVAYDHRDVGRSTVLHDAPGDVTALRAAMSGHPFDPPYRLSDLAEDAVGLLDHLGVDRAHVVGVSMGGMIGQHLAFAHPERVISLVSVNSSPGIAPPDEPLETPVEVVDPTPPAGAEAFVDWFVDGLRELSSPRWFDEPRTRELARAVQERGVHPAASIRHLLAMLADGDRTSRLARITAPTLVIHGADDPLVRLEEGRATAEAIPGARLVIVEDMAHELPLPLVPRLLRDIVEHVRGAVRRAPEARGE
jgi:pimeloyl-ACP methyl ester carboxylesterase